MMGLPSAPISFDDRQHVGSDRSLAMIERDETTQIESSTDGAEGECDMERRDVTLQETAALPEISSAVYIAQFFSDVGAAASTPRVT